MNDTLRQLCRDLRRLGGAETIHPFTASRMTVAANEIEHLSERLEKAFGEITRLSEFEPHNGSSGQ